MSWYVLTNFLHFELLNRNHILRCWPDGDSPDDRGDHHDHAQSDDPDPFGPIYDP